MDAGGLERLNEPRAQAESDAVAVPELDATARHETDEARFGQRLAVLGHAEQVLPRFLVADVLARVDVAGADTVLQRNAPVPARAARDRGGVRRPRNHVRYLHR